MANYYATARSNYFAVKDEASFQQWAESTGLKILNSSHSHQNTDGIRRFAITPDSGDENGWPSHRENETTEEYEDLDLYDELAPHLKDGEVAVLMEIGNEKLRYLCGFATAVNSAGQTVSMSLDGIYDLAKNLGSNITRAEY